MFTKKEEELFFLGFLNNNKSVLEYGSGESTLEIAKKVKKIVSIEHQKHWHDVIKSKTINLNNVTLILKEPNLPFTEGFEDGDYKTFKDYVDAPVNYYPFDVILIDGRARAACSESVAKNCNKETLVFMHDYNTDDITRENYKTILNWFDIVDKAGSMYLFKRK